MTSKELKFKFDRHGLGDVVHFAHAVQLYKRRGYDVTVQVEENKLFLWKVAGVNIVQGGGLPDHSYHYPAGFDDLNQPDCDTNKVAFGLRHDVMPRLEDLGLTPQQAWDELCGVRLSAHDLIPPEAHVEAERFLEGMPRPIICFHSRGTNWHERKSIPTETAFDTILKLLDQTGGSVIVLDYDRRAPMVGDERCKGIKPGWGHISVDRLCALYERSDLMIGVDSGPFHVAALTQVPALGVFRSLNCCRVCLPNPNALYLVNHRDAQHWAVREDKWSTITYPGPEPTADDVAVAAIKLLSGNKPKAFQALRHLSGWYEYHRIGHDSRKLELKPDGMIGAGAEGCEQRWFATSDSQGASISLTGKHGVICCCLREDDGVFRGRWNRFEKMPVELTAISQPTSTTLDPERVCVVMNWDEAFDDLAAITAPNRRDYAARHGYGFATTRFPGAWGKLNAILAAWDDADWLFWLDADALITNPQQGLHALMDDNAYVILTRDRNGLCSGSMLIRTHPNVKAVFEDLLKRREEFDLPGGNCEQNGLAALFWKIANNVKALPKRKLDPYPAKYYQEVPPDEGWHAGDFAIHVPALPLARRAEILREYVGKCDGIGA